MRKGVKVIRGDCLPVLRSLPRDSIDLIVTDPPYGIGFVSGYQTHDNRQGKNRKVRDAAYFSGMAGDNTLQTAWLCEAFEVLRDGCGIYVFCHWKNWGLLQLSALHAGFRVKNMIVLNKSNHGMGDLSGAYAPKHELVLFASKGRHVLNFPSGREKDVWNVPVIHSKSIRLHPSRKPESWCIPMIENSSKPGDIVLDPFCGSGTVGVVCVSLRRAYVGIEIDPIYVNVAKERISKACQS